ncbi:putative quinol monooxygenase [Bacillus sp. NPDC077027]|uniref:putative quinol monooxygenase n=1 Tax=Bacillus sp. NPDC077027 TaxID=3390548 RepID=UPI003CFE4907
MTIVFGQANEKKVGGEAVLHIVHVFFDINEEDVEAFKKACEKNATASQQEEGVFRFDVLQQTDNPTLFLLTEFYYSREDQLQHRETEHFKVWKAEIGDYLRQPYTFQTYDYA